MCMLHKRAGERERDKKERGRERTKTYFKTMSKKKTTAIDQTFVFRKSTKDRLLSCQRETEERARALAG